MVDLIQELELLRESLADLIMNEGQTELTELWFNVYLSLQKLHKDYLTKYRSVN